MLSGKGFFIWKILECENGDVVEIAEKARAAKFSHVLIKIANGIYSYNYDWEKNIDLVPSLAQELWARGIEVWGWHYVFGDQPVQEANKAINRIRELNVDGFVIDAEGHYKGKFSSAKTFMDRLKREITDIPVALSSYRYPSYHPQLPWDAFLSQCDLNMPQVYWLKAHNPGAQLERSVEEFRNLEYTPPIFPTGAAFTEWGWSPTADEITAFMNKAKALNLSGINFWEWANCQKKLPREIWQTIKDYPWEGDPQPAEDITEAFIKALNSHNPQKVMALYQDKAVHITSSRTIQGKEALTNWYQSFFNQLLPDGEFTLTNFSGTGNIRHLTWTASSSKGSVPNGSDTLGVIDGKISYHFSEFDIRD
ncbi:MAG: nuclear transport factor 2 family protein [Anaerolineales bacterium]|nr:nuclear transport factor 2 family protein [Anaerolineales bacterium]